MISATRARADKILNVRTEHEKTKQFLETVKETQRGYFHGKRRSAAALISNNSQEDLRTSDSHVPRQA